MLPAVDQAQHRYPLGWVRTLSDIMAHTVVIVWRYSRHRGALLIDSDESAAVQTHGSAHGRRPPLLGCACVPTTELFCIYAADGQCFHRVARQLVRVRFSSAAVQPCALKAKTETRRVALRPMRYRTQHIRDRSSMLYICRRQGVPVSTCQGGRSPAAYHMPHVYLEGPRGQTSFLFNDVPFHERYLSSDQDSLAMVLLNRAGRSAHAVVSS
ncbi:hypothetical protein F5883DRAFT_206195 [Diaporthe sp. PMI_573]|nr:hypothetical protein F5883DRAFT_206195 [Diaporthaceae sp. PMI_573]